MTRTKVLYVEQNTDGTIGGSHYCLLDLIMRLREKLYDCEVVFYEKHSLYPHFKRSSRVCVLERPKRLRSPKSLSVLRKAVNLVLMLRDVRRFRAFLADRKPDIVHLNNSFCVGYDTWGTASKLEGVPVVTHERGFFGQPLVERALKHTDVFAKILCVSDAVRDHYISLGAPRRRLVTVHDGIDPVSFVSRVARSRKDVRQEFGLTEEQPLIGMVGNIKHWKGQHVLVSAISRVKKKIPNIHCLLIGSTGRVGSENERYPKKIIQMVQESNLSDNVTITGYRADVPDIMNGLDVLIHASTTPDPFPHVILEGMSLGLPIIASQSGGAVESVEDGKTGFLCIPGNKEMMATYIEGLLLDPTLRRQMGEAGLRRVRNFSMESHANKVKEYYSEVLDMKKVMYP